MTKKKYINILCVLVLTTYHLDAMEQLSSALERFKSYSPYLAVPAFNFAQYDYRKNIPIRERYLNPYTAYFGTAAASTAASALLNRDLGWRSALGWALLKNIPAWLSGAYCFHNEVFAYDIANKEAALKHEQKEIKAQVQKQHLEESLTAISQEIEQNWDEKGLDKIIKRITVIISYIDKSEIIPQSKNEYANQAQDLLTQAKDKLRLVKRTNTILEIIQNKITSTPLLVIANDVPIDTIIEEVGNAEIDGASYFGPSSRQNYDELSQQINAISEIINHAKKITTLIGLSYLTDALNEQVTKNSIVTEDQKALLNKNIKKQNDKISNMLIYEATLVNHQYSLEEVYSLAQFVNNLLLKKTLNVTDSLIDDLQLQTAITQITEHTSINITDQIEKNPQKAPELTMVKEILTQNYNAFLQAITYAQLLRQQERRVRAETFIR